VHVDTELGAKDDLLNNRMAYVAVWREAHDAQLFTNDREKLPAALGHEVSRETAHTPQLKQDQVHPNAPAGDRAEAGTQLRNGTPPLILRVRTESILETALKIALDSGPMSRLYP